MGQEAHHIDAVLAPVDGSGVPALARRQHGVISTAQLKASGLGRGAIARRVQGGWLRPLYRGVYVTGHAPLSFRGHCWAAILACGGPDAAVVSHRTAAALHGVMNVPSGRIDVTSLRRSVSTKAIRVHKGDTLNPDTDIAVEGGLPRTSVARTLSDLAAVLTPHQLRRVCHRAEHLRLIDMNAIAAQRPSRKMRAALHDLAIRAPEITRSELEERFLALLDAHALPRPLVNARVNGHEVDFCWPNRRLVVEADGAATHVTATAFRHDRRRDVELTLAGYRVARFTHADVFDHPAHTARTIGRLLAG